MCSALNQISEKFSGPVLQEGGKAVADFRHLIVELKEILQKEKEESEVGGLRCCDSLPLLSTTLLMPPLFPFSSQKKSFQMNMIKIFDYILVLSSPPLTRLIDK